MKLNKNTILLVGGGTGGHAVPVFEIYKALKQKDEDLNIIIVGSGAPAEEKIFGKVDNYKTIKAGKINRYVSIKNFFEPFKTFCGIIASHFLLMKYKPAVIFSKGGYVSFPVIYVAKFFKIPYLIHESDLELGMANKFASFGAKIIFLGFPLKNYSDLPKDRAVFSGQILRADLMSGERKSVDPIDFGFKDKKPVLLITGGSQGASNINKSVAEAIPELLLNYNVIHQTGQIDFSKIKELKDGLSAEQKDSYFIADFLSIKDSKDLMQEAILLADLVIARAGATTVAELAAKKKAMVLIPYKYASGDHQTKNAKIVEDAGGAVVISDDELSPKRIKETLLKLSQDNKGMEKMGENAYNLFPRNGLEIITDEIIKENNKSYEEV